MEPNTLGRLAIQIRAEHFKNRRHFAVAAAVVAPLLVLIIGLLDLLHDSPQVHISASAVVWARVNGAVWVPWIAAILPLLICLVAASLINLEHSGDHWKQLFTYPLPTWGFYASKMAYAALLFCLSVAIASLGMLALGLGYAKTLESSPVTGIWFHSAASEAMSAYFSCWPIIVLQTWISARFNSFAASLGLGLIALVIGIALFDPSSVLSYLYPWTLPLSTNPLFKHHDPLIPAWTGSFGGLMLGALSCWRLGRSRGSKRRSREM